MNARLYVGNKNYSSWSLRAWLCLEWSGIEYDEVLIDLRQPGYGKGQIKEVLAVSPAGRVPALRVGETEVWDSLAIAEWASEASQGALWPADPLVRATARAATCEMHSGFPHIRQNMPMNLHGRRKAPSWDEPTTSEIERVRQLWSDFRARHQEQGPWLFGKRSIADAFYAPVAARFRTYEVELAGAAEAYCGTLLQDESFLKWEEASEADSWDRDGYPVIDGIYADAEEI